MKFRIFTFYLVFLCDIQGFGQLKFPYIKTPDTDLPVFNNGARFLHCKYKSAIWKEEIGYLVFLPKDYYTNTDTSFPLILYLHGYGSNYSKAEKYKAWNGYMDSYFPQSVVVNVNAIENIFYTGEVEKTIIEELIPHLRTTYRISDKSECSAIIGVSMGGYGAAKLGLQYSNLFSQFASIAPGSLSDIDEYIIEYKENGTGKLQMRAIVGTADGVCLESTHKIKQKIEDAGLILSYKEYYGFNHDISIFTDSVVGNDMFTWIADNFRKTCPSPVRSDTLTSLPEEKLPYVNEFNPFGATPFPVPDFKVAKADGAGFYLSWGKYSKLPDSYIIQRSNYKEYQFKTIDSVAGDQLFCIDSIDVFCKTKYDYRIMSRNAYGYSVPVYHPSIDFNCTSIDNQEYKNKNVEIFPNPAKKRFVISVRPEYYNKGLKVILCNTYGNLVSIKPEFTNGHLIVNESLPTGMYFLYIVCNKEVVGRGKIIIQP